MMNTLMRPFAARRARRGISMIEALFVLGFAVLFVLGALYLFNQANTGNRNRNAVTQIQNVQQAVRTLFAGQSDYGSTGAIQDITPVVLNSRLLPQNMISGTAIRHAFGGALTVSAVGAGTAWTGVTVNAPTFIVTMADVPNEACVSLMTADSGGGTSGLVQAVVATVSVVPPITPTGVVATATALCGATTAPTGGRNTMAWRYQ